MFVKGFFPVFSFEYFLQTVLIVLIKLFSCFLLFKEKVFVVFSIFSSNQYSFYPGFYLGPETTIYNLGTNNFHLMYCRWFRSDYGYARCLANADIWCCRISDAQT